MKLHAKVLLVNEKNELWTIDNGIPSVYFSYWNEHPKKAIMDLVWEKAQLKEPWLYLSLVDLCGPYYHDNIFYIVYGGLLQYPVKSGELKDITSFLEEATQTDRDILLTCGGKIWQ